MTLAYQHIALHHNKQYEHQRIYIDCIFVFWSKSQKSCSRFWSTPSLLLQKISSYMKNALLTATPSRIVQQLG